MSFGPEISWSLVGSAVTLLATLAYRHPGAYVKKLLPALRWWTWGGMLCALHICVGMYLGIELVREHLPPELAAKWSVLTFAGLAWPIFAWFLAFAVLVEILARLKEILDLDIDEAGRKR